MSPERVVPLLFLGLTSLAMLGVLYLWAKDRPAESLRASAVQALVFAVCAGLFASVVSAGVGVFVIRLAGWDGEANAIYRWLAGQLAVPVPLAFFGSLVLCIFLVLLAIRAQRRSEEPVAEGDPIDD